MANLSRTWWGKRFISALEGFTDVGRLERGRAYGSDHRILKFDIEAGKVSATVRGNINPYFGVYTEPHYEIQLKLKPISAKGRATITKALGNNAALLSRLLMNEMPDNIDAAFADAKLSLLPRDRRDFATTRCDCPDDANPCKHLAGVYYRLAAKLDNDPFLLFELRGLPRDELYQALSSTPLGAALGALIADKHVDIGAAESFFSRPLPSSATPNYDEFWNARQGLPTELEPANAAAVPAALVKKGGDYPAFWPKERSFIAVMEELYLRVREKNKAAL